MWLLGHTHSRSFPNTRRDCEWTLDTSFRDRHARIDSLQKVADAPTRRSRFGFPRTLSREKERSRISPVHNTASRERERERESLRTRARESSPQSRRDFVQCSGRPCFSSQSVSLENSDAESLEIPLSQFGVFQRRFHKRVSKRTPGSSHHHLSRGRIVCPIRRMDRVLEKPRNQHAPKNTERERERERERV